MGGSVVLELNKEFKDKNYKARTYDAPVVSLVAPIFGFDRPTEQHKRFRMTGDLVSRLDNAAITQIVSTLYQIMTLTDYTALTKAYPRWVGFRVF